MIPVAKCRVGSMVIFISSISQYIIEFIPISNPHKVYKFIFYCSKTSFDESLHPWASVRDKVETNIVFITKLPYSFVIKFFSTIRPYLYFPVSYTHLRAHETRHD